MEPNDVGVASPAGLAGMLRESVGATPESIALRVHGDERGVTYSELEQRAAAMASGLVRLGYQRGDVLALWMPNSVEWVVIELAAARLGLLVLSLNTRYKVAEVAHLLSVAQPRGLFFAPDFHDVDFEGMAESALAEARSSGIELEHVVTLGADVEPGFGGGVTVHRFETLADGVAASREDPVGLPQDPVNVFGTSGTTSFPKLAIHTQHGIRQHVERVADSVGLTASDVVLGQLPFCGALGFVTLMAALYAGSSVVILPVYTHDLAVEAIEEHGVSFVVGTEAIVRSMLSVGAARPAMLRSWTRAAAAGVNIHDVISAGAAHDIAVGNVYGSSEILGLAAMWDADDYEETRAIPGGRLVSPGMHVRVVDPLSGEVVEQGDVGELQFRGTSVTTGYLANDSATASAFTPDGWYRSQDRGTVLEGGRAFAYQSRLVDTLRLRGYLVNPSEIEEHLGTHPAVFDSYVVGVPDESTGEDRAFAFVRPRDGMNPDPEELRQFCKGRIASWKVPETVVVSRDLPSTPGANGDKVQKTRLREVAIQLAATSRASREGQ